ncbi:MAG TPA: class I SAM-dependent methyltransferase [Candidatus Baltobacteraceae bacterium]|jgi:SAM-dependent methyltransferase|nr:class I SAM-dependent methyltransferase [Candidatus Baltobacteraceae bacterium]
MEKTARPLFKRAGFAALSDLQRPDYRETLELLERVEDEFARAAPAFRHPQYKWGTETLHTWSRAWEYAYVFEHLVALQPQTIVDFGSGSTFFPFALARAGHRIICLDSDPVAVEDLCRAIEHVSAGAGTIEPRANGETLPVESGQADAVYSISVLEHVDEPAAVVTEIARVLKPDGTFVLTFDLDVEKNTGVGVLPEQYEALRDVLEASFEWVYPDRVIHPLDVLTSKNSPWPVPGERKVPGLLWRDRSARLRPLVGGPNPGVLTVYGCVLRRRRASSES